MPSLLPELLIFGAVGAGVTAVALGAQRGRAARRATTLASSGTASFPCRISWPAGMGKKAFVYGKVVTGDGGQLTFARRGRSPVPLPRSGSVRVEPSWRTGLVTLRYDVPGQGDVRMLLNETDAETVEGLLRAV
ncbi:hypothetical protein HLK59_28030 [Streptomyces sp. S3(2020)]|uniref:hypothetical protein n=1 Tax=Streptomyces sp. S3(2020) TaxID=2732044 RepID=UPI00148830E6|nr:hypothetical protein [Streptomyces sp. S3(2020)]NNN34143.1 hypothetical protein [Streptomyces sp. S3(2020)]